MDERNISKLLGDLRLLRRYRQERSEKQPFRLRIPYMRNELRHAALNSWEGGYVLSESGDYFYLPMPVDDAVGYRLLKPYGYPKLLRTLCREGDVVMDIGANLGEWTVPMARHVGATGRVITVEPIPRMAQAIRKTCRINRLPQVTLVEAALSDSNGQASFTINSTNSGNSSLGERQGIGEQIIVQTYTLDTLIDSLGNVERLDFIKIDVEGFEHVVICGGLKTLRKYRPAVVLETGYEGETERDRMRGCFESLDYEVVGIDVDGGVIETDWGAYCRRQGIFAVTGVANMLIMPKL